MLCLPPNAPLLSCLSLLVLQQKGGSRTGQVEVCWGPFVHPQMHVRVRTSQQCRFFCPSEHGPWNVHAPHLCFRPAFPPPWMSAHGQDSLHQCFLDKDKPKGGQVWFPGALSWVSFSVPASTCTRVAGRAKLVAWGGP